jgi:hypothetical protein
MVNPIRKFTVIMIMQYLLNIIHFIIHNYFYFVFILFYFFFLQKYSEKNEKVDTLESMKGNKNMTRCP